MGSKNDYILRRIIEDSEKEVNKIGGGESDVFVSQKFERRNSD